MRQSVLCLLKLNKLQQQSHIFNEAKNAFIETIANYDYVMGKKVKSEILAQNSDVTPN